MGIDINNLKPLGGDLLSGSESIMGSLRVLSEEELSISGGGYYPYHGSKSSKSSKSKSSKSKSSKSKSSSGGYGGYH